MESAPYWVSYADIIKLKGGIPVEIKTDIKNNFKMTGKQLESAITKKTKMVWFSSPCNPSGSVYSADEFDEISSILESRKNIFVTFWKVFRGIFRGFLDVFF